MDHTAAIANGKRPEIDLSPSLREITTDALHRVRPNLPIWARPTGNYGVTLLRTSYSSQVLLKGTSKNHLIGVMDSQPVLTQHMMAGERLEHQTRPGSICIGPAGADYSVEFLGPVSGVVLEVNTECLAMVQAQSGLYNRQLLPNMNGLDNKLSRLTTLLESEVCKGHPNGVLLWSSVVDALLRHLVEHRFSEARPVAYGTLGPEALRRLSHYVAEYIAESFDLEDMARVAGCEKFRFAHAFKKCVGVSPHRFVVRKRIERARTLIAAGRHTLVEVAAMTGFSDQSHLHHWIKRICGVTPGQLMSPRSRKNLQDAVDLRA